MLARVGFMLPSPAERRRNGFDAAHAMKSRAACLSRDAAVIASDQVQRFGRRSPVGTRRRQRVADAPDQLGVLLVLEEGDVVVGVDEQGVAAAGEVERELVPALVGPVDGTGVAQRLDERGGHGDRLGVGERGAAVGVEVAAAAAPQLGREAGVDRVPLAAAALPEAAHLSPRLRTSRATAK